MGNSLTEFLQAGPHGRQFHSELAAPVPRSRNVKADPQKSMMPTAGKCYIVLRTFAFSRKDSL
jgi:hypothetical protein